MYPNYMINDDGKELYFRRPKRVNIGHLGITLNRLESCENSAESFGIHAGVMRNPMEFLCERPFRIDPDGRKVAPWNEKIVKL